MGWFVIRVQKYGTPHKYAIKKQRKVTTRRVCAQLGGCTMGATVVRCRVKAAALLQVSCVSLVQVSCNKVGEIVRVQTKCVTALTPHETTARARVRPSCCPLRGPRGPSIDARRPANRRSRHAPFGRPLQAAAAEQVGHNSLQHTSSRVGFYSVGMHFDAPKPDAGGEGVAPG